MGAPHGSAGERLWRHVDKTDECWLWRGSVDHKGYGQLMDHSTGKRVLLRIHRLAWVLASGEPVPEGLDVLHTCDVHVCSRNDEPGVYMVRGVALPRFGHLFLGTDADNMHDMMDKGRARFGGGAHRGEEMYNSKLTEESVRDARILAARVSLTKLAARYGVSRKTLTQAVRGVRWAHVE